MRPVTLALSLAMISLAACAQQTGNDRRIQGLVAHHGAVTLKECRTGKVYWVRGAPGLLSSLERRRHDLTGDNGSDVVAEIRGETIDLGTSVGAAYPVHGTLWASQVVSVEPGDC